MRDLKDYLECEGGGGAMPSNTLGAGNPGLVGPSTLSEPLTQGQINNQPTAKTKKEKKNTSKTKNMKDLKEHLNESLMITETQRIQLSAYHMNDMIKFAANFDVNSDEWDEWDDVWVDPTWAEKHKPFIKNLCKVCTDIVKNKNINFGTAELGNFPYNDSYTTQELLADEFDPKKGDYYYFLTGDGDDGEFFYMKVDADANQATYKLARELTELTMGAGNWDWESVTYDK